MDLTSFPPVTALLHASSAAIDALAGLVAPLAGSASTAVAVVLVTILVRAALLPAAFAQARGERARAVLAPQIAALQRRYATQPARLRRELAELSRREGASPLAGCLPALVQAPVLALVTTLFAHASIAGEPNALFAHELGGVPLGRSLAGSVGAGTADGSVLLVFGVILAVVVAVTAVSRRRFRPAAPAAPGASPSGAPVPSAALVRMLGFLPFATAVVAAFVPLAAAVSLAATVVWTLGQRLVLRRLVPPRGGTAPRPA